MIETQFKKGGATKAALLAKFNVTNPDIVLGDFMFYIADTFVMGVQYGSRAAMCTDIGAEYFNEDPVSRVAVISEWKGTKYW